MAMMMVIDFGIELEGGGAFYWGVRGLLAQADEAMAD